MADKAWASALPLLLRGDLGDGGNDFRRHEAAADDVVPDDLAGHESEARHERSRPSARDRDELRDSLDGSAQAPADDGARGPGMPGRRGRGALGKGIVAIAVERLGVGQKSQRVALGRVRLQRIPNVQMTTLTDFVLDTCDLDAVIYTDHWVGYNDLGNAGFTHVKTNISASGDPAHVAMPCVHRVASLMKRWLLGAHQGGVSIRQLDFYLDEFVFRFNRRKSKSRGLLFYRLMEQAVTTTPKPAKTIIGGRP